MFNKIFGDPQKKYIKNLEPIIEEINKYEKRFAYFSQDDFRKKTKEFKKRFKQGESLNDLLPCAFALVRVAARKTIGERPYREQLITGIVLHRGEIAEMKTGEGKTLAAVMPLYLNALAQKSVYLVTVNDYLARRDVNWMGPIFDLLGLKVSCLQSGGIGFVFKPQVKPDKEEVTVEYENLEKVSRKQVYQADIVYGTNHEFGFDYLRDNMAYNKEQIVQKERNFVILDEIDSILIDEARTPLIISAPDKESPQLYKEFSKIVTQLKKDKHYTVDVKHRKVNLTEQGMEKVSKLLKHDIYKKNNLRLIYHLQQSLRAQALFFKDKDYIIKKGKVIIIDSFTGRLMPDRRYSGGLHQAIEAKENVEVKPESRTLASITLQNYFRLYNKLAGMTGTGVTSAEEFHKVYNLEVIVIPTHKPCIRKDLSDVIYKTRQAKFNAVVEKIKQLNKKGQPVLIGTNSIVNNEYLSDLLKKEGIKHEVLNAKYHEKEACIISQAGRVGAVTVATNMAGRGTDIKLGGEIGKRTKQEWQKEHNKVKKLGGLFVLGTVRHESRRIDNQLRGRCGRQGEPGKSQFYVSLEDELMRRFGSNRLSSIMNKLKLPDDMPIENKMVSKAIAKAQAQVEGYNFDIRKRTLEYDNLLNKQREEIYSRRRKILKIKDQLKRQLKLRIIDVLWLNHLEYMDMFRSSVGLRAYGQQDPLAEYRKEGSLLFKQLLDRIKKELKAIDKAIKENKIKIKKQGEKKTMAEQFGQGAQKVVLQQKTVGRNDPCPCGSGKKYKKCCLYKNK